MSKQYTTVRIDTEQWGRLAAVREQTGIPIAAQIRRAVDVWLELKEPVDYGENDYEDTAE